MKRRLKKKVVAYFVISLIIIIAIIVSIIMIVNYNKKIHSIPYKLEKLGYQDEEITFFEDFTQQENAKPNMDEILNHAYHKDLASFLKEKYFIYDNLERYLAYKDKNTQLSNREVVRLINVNRDHEYYENIKKTDTSKENIMLVNKYYALDKDFVFDDLVNVSVQHCYGNQKIRKEVYEKFKQMFNDAKKENLTIIINSSYRTYDYQENLWNNYARTHDEAWADNYAARAGHSEHQTGLTIDVTTYGVKEQGDFEATDEFAWMKDNAHKYGFILRYPKEQENITGYSYESWHYRYVGVDIATKIYEEGITFDEYYAFYLE